MEQVVTNLLDNAIKFSPSGGTIEVEVSAPTPDTVRLAVSDPGIGIPPDRRARIFQRFYQAHADDHRSGMGLGLYISRQIVELHGGHIAADFRQGRELEIESIEIEDPEPAPPVAAPLEKVEDPS